MLSKIHEAALRLDYTSTMWRFTVTGDQSELEDLLPEQLFMLSRNFAPGSPEYVEIHNLYRAKKAALKP